MSVDFWLKTPISETAMESIFSVNNNSAGQIVRALDLEEFCYEIEDPSLGGQCNLQVALRHVEAWKAANPIQSWEVGSESEEYLRLRIGQLHVILRANLTRLPEHNLRLTWG